MAIFIIFLLILNIEAVTNILSKSEIFIPLRSFLFRHSDNKVMKFLHDLLDCPYCTSVWVSLFYIGAIYAVAGVYALSCVFVFCVLVIAFHRMANILHHIIDRVDKSPGYDVLMDKENDQ